MSPCAKEVEGDAVLSILWEPVRMDQGQELLPSFSQAEQETKTNTEAARCDKGKPRFCP